MKPYIFPSSTETARALITHLVTLMSEEPDRTFYMAFSGGATPSLMFDLWANEYKEVTPWERLKVFWVDERCVPVENSDSNYGVLRSLLLSAVAIPYQNIFPIRGEGDPRKEAERYTQVVMSEVPRKNGLPVFDVVLLGAGSDGHTASIFPGQETLLTTDRICEACFDPHNGQKRVSLTGFPIVNARRVIFLLTGRPKADVAWEICHSGDTCPAAYIAHHAANVEVFMDRLAGSRVG